MSKDLRVQIEGLPEQIKVSSYKTKVPLVLYWRDGLDVIKHLFTNPVFMPCMDFRPYQEFEGPDGHADHAWEIQDKLPPGYSFVGVIGASDKTPLMIRTGNKEMHPLLISLANIHAGVHMKATSHVFALIAARDGCVMSDLRGDLCMIHTPLVAWIADYPEQLLIACTASKHSPISLAVSTQFWDPLPHSPQICSHTIDAIERACAISDHCDIASFYKACQTLHLNGVVELYWMDWGDACPSHFLMPDALHQWHKFFFNHPITWSINIMGGAELNL
ncbi:uncharacterized protein BJ212DRAFT_1443794 [Suillus subaureus]|uniref:Uncharacterized protein n=1 Tax=Suillus subaureus TaxID=48587 RepID=A0A9P7EME7_9AGAM|nr:uncharacterized protein BJ212DRAFT_1443794 [Suillus subaureus]KAG1825738.1 hypothetical protein BJ212DRAFT_1443794 [Suillus subaureus]